MIWEKLISSPKWGGMEKFRIFGKISPENIDDVNGK